MPLSRSWLNSLVDDSGAGLDGTVWNKYEIGLFHDVIDAALLPIETGRPHAPSHALGGLDPVNVLLLAGYPGGTSLFLRADGAFAAPTTVIPANVAKTDQSNVFTAPQAFAPYIAIYDPSGTPDQRRWGIAAHLATPPGGLVFASITDNDAAATAYIQMNRDGTLVAAGLGSTPLNASQLTSGTIPDARLSANVQLKPIAATDLPAHAARHASGGADPVNVLTLAGYPGGTTLFLRGDGTFALPPSGGGGGPHAATHAQGGGDTVTITTLGGFPGGTATYLRADGTFAAPPSASAGGANTQVQYNVGGGFAGHPYFTFDNAVGKVTLGADLLFSSNVGVARNTADGADIGYSTLAGGGAAHVDRGGYVYAVGNEYGGAQSGHVGVYMGNVAGSTFRVFNGAGLERLKIVGTAEALFSCPLNIKQQADGIGYGLIVLQAGAGTGYVTLHQANATYASLGVNGGTPISFGSNGDISANAMIYSAGLAISTSRFIVNMTDGSLVSASPAAAAWIFNSTYANGSGLRYQRSGVNQLWVGGAAPHGMGGTADDALIYLERPGRTLFIEVAGPGGNIRSKTMYDDVTGTGAANFVVEADGRLRRVTSSARYKTAIEPLAAWRWLLDVSAVEFADARTPDGRKMGGFLAEDIARVGPTRNGVPMFAGLNADGEPDDVAYANLVAVLQLGIKELDRRLAALERAR